MKCVCVVGVNIINNNHTPFYYCNENEALIDIIKSFTLVLWLY